MNDSAAAAFPPATPKPFLWTFDRSSWEGASKTETFSVGVYQWLPAKSGNGLKKSKSVRVAGYTADSEAVYLKARQLCSKLNRCSAKAEAPPDWLQKQYSIARPVASLSKPTIKKRLVEMAKKILEPELQKSGFKRSGQNFWRNNEAVCHVISPQLKWFGTATHGGFDIFLGVLWHEIESALGNSLPRKMPPAYRRCTFTVDLGWVTPTRLQRSWELSIETNLANLGDAILSDLVAYGIPWLEYRSDLKHALEWKKFRRQEGRGLFSSHEHLSCNAKRLFRMKLGLPPEPKQPAESPRQRKLHDAAISKMLAKEAEQLRRIGIRSQIVGNQRIVAPLRKESKRKAKRDRGN